MESHRVRAADIASLATGRGDAAIVRCLAAGQLSRRLLRLYALLAAARDLPADEAAAFLAGYDLAAAVQQRNPSLFAEVLMYPSVGTWSAFCLRRLRATEPGAQPVGTDLGHLGAIAAAAAARAGYDFEIHVPLRAGTVTLPTLGVARLSPGGHGGRAVLRGSGGSVELVAGRNAVAMPADPSTDGPGWCGLRRLRAAAGGEAITVALDDIDPFRAGRDLRADKRIAASIVPRWQRVFSEAWTILVSRHPWYSDAISAGLVMLVPLAGRLERDSMSATSRDAFGACALSAPPDAQSLAVTLVHEFQHAKLGALSDLAPLHNPGPDVRSYSPWRDDPRPVSGLLQGAYAYLGVTDLWRTERGVNSSACSGEDTFAHFEFARWREQTWHATSAIERSGRLTATGHDLVAGMRKRLRGWCTEPVPEGPSRAAVEAIADHRLSWRLRNLRPDRDDVGRLAAAWIAGAQPWPGRTPPTVVQSDRALTRNPRLELLYRRLKDPRQFTSACAGGAPGAPEGISEGDLAYACGDFAAAARRYREMIASDPGRVDAWAGLALAGAWPERSALMQSPELVYALHSRIREFSATVPDPGELTAWLDSVLDPSDTDSERRTG